MIDSETRDRMFQDEQKNFPKPNEHVLRPLVDGCQANDSPELLGDQYYAPNTDTGNRCSSKHPINPLSPDV